MGEESEGVDSTELLLSCCLSTGQDQRRIVSLLFAPIIIIPTLPLPFRITPSQVIGARGAGRKCTILGQQPNSIQFTWIQFSSSRASVSKTFPGSSNQFFRVPSMQETGKKRRRRKSFNHEPATPILGQWQTEKKEERLNYNAIHIGTYHTAEFAPPIRTSCLHEEQKKKKNATHKESYSACTHSHDQIPAPSTTASKKGST